MEPSVGDLDTFAKRRDRVLGILAAAATPSPQLIAVSKSQPEAAIDEALAAGQRVFGENRVQEAGQRWQPRRAAYPDLILHLIGPLQTNKAEAAVRLFDVIQSVDRPKLVDALVAAAQKTGRWPTFFVQVNTGEEPQKAGVSPADLPALLAYASAAGLKVSGLMCIPPAEALPGPHFALLARLARRHGLAGLSMGMSGDFELAARHGATHVRVGTALFGGRLG